ncbi:MAG TPA: hypothetical protein VGF48_05785 [Thermoanaerobaculia bacterium]|jgi:hypothetical protein
MKKEIVQVDKDRGIARVTTLDERFYSREVEDPETGLPVIEFRPSITYIGKFYPKGKGYENFLKKNGDEAEIIRDLAGERGSKVHQAIEALNKGETVGMRDKFTSNLTGEAEELTPDEYYAVMTYKKWWDEEGSKEYEILEVESIVWPEGPGSEPGGLLHFAATKDIRLKRKSDGTTGTVDVKTSKDIYPSHIIQVSAIAEACGDAWQAILQVGYTRTQKGYKFTETERRLDLLRAATTIHAYETGGEKPLQRDYPLTLSLNLPKEGEEAPAAEPAPKAAKPNKREDAAT